jgi:hypothetical protein
MSLASDSSNGGFVPSCLYMSWSLSSRLFSIVHIVVPSGLCRVVFVGCVGCCASSYWWVECVSRSWLMGVVEKVRFGDLQPYIVRGFSGRCVFLSFGGLVCFVCSVIGLLGRFHTP